MGVNIIQVIEDIILSPCGCVTVLVFKFKLTFNRFRELFCINGKVKNP